MAFIKTRKKILSSTIASTLSVVAMNAVAQEQVTQLKTIESTASPEQKSLKVDESANSKFVVPLLDTAKSVSVISQQLIEDTRVTTLADALRTVPGVTLGAGEGGNPNGDRPIIRGFSSENAMYVDGIRNSTSQNRDMFAVEQVEVVKGSGSALGGAGSVGGSINMISKEAKKGSFIQGSIEQGTDDYQRITLDGNKDFGNGIAARVAVLGHKNDKPGQNDGAEYKRAGIAPSIAFGLDTDTRATLSYYYLKTDDIPDSGVPYGTLGTSNNSGSPIDVKKGIYYGWKARDFQKQENQIGTIKLEHDLTDDLTISNIASYSKSKNDYVWTQPDDSQKNIANYEVWRRANSRITDSNTFTDQLALKGKLNTGSLIHRFNTGVEYSHQKSDKGNYVIDPGIAKIDTGTIKDGQKVYASVDSGSLTTGACSSYYGVGADSGYYCTSATDPNPNDPFLGTITANRATTTTKTETTSLYFLDNIEINPQWLLDLGIRWDKFDTKLITNDGKTAPISSNTDFFSYQAGLTFKPAENGAIYASFATSANPVGVDAGDGNESIGANYSNLDPEKARTFEIGTKWDVLDNRVNLTAAIFRTEKQNARVQLAPTTYANIGKSIVDGFELGINGNLTSNWAVFAGYTYLDSDAKDNGTNCSGRGANVTCDGKASTNNGNRLPNVAKNSASLWTTYQVSPAFMIGGGAFAMDKVYGDLANTKFVPGYVRYDAMARYNINQNVDLQLNVNNLTDKRYFNKAFASHYATEADGRNAILSINFKY